jgi:hypothetical protein
MLMIAIARTPPAFDRRHLVQLAGALVAGIAIGASAVAGLGERPAEAGSQPRTVPAVRAPAAVAPRQQATTASEAYRPPYRAPAPAASTTASEQYRAPYARPAPAASTTAGEEYRAQYAGGE